jgi:serine/threonine protein kinase
VVKIFSFAAHKVVYLCRLPTLNDRLVVIKVMKKTKLIRLNQVKNVIREKELVTRFDCPYIVSALGSFQVFISRSPRHPSALVRTALPKVDTNCTTPSPISNTNSKW